jgi:hypothetical protein
MEGKMKTLTVIGRRWFQKTWGNTHHSVEVYVDGKLIQRKDFVYGYERHYLQTAEEILVCHGFLQDLEQYANGGSESLWRYCEKHNIQFTDSVTDVSRKKDL